MAEALEASLSDLPALSLAAVARGKKLLAPLQGLEVDDVDAACDKAFREAWVMFVLALQANPENAEAQAMLTTMQAAGMNGGLASCAPADERAEGRPAADAAPNHSFPLDVVVVGAGCSGIGAACMLIHGFGLDPARVLIVERGTVGETFKRWPKEMRFISPSFNSQGWTQSFDLNSVAYNTSPAFMLHAEHPTGDQYAAYLAYVATVGGLPVRPNSEAATRSRWPFLGV